MRMLSFRKIKFYRLLERLLLFFFFIWTVGAAVLFVIEMLSIRESIVAGAVSLMLLIILVYIQTVVGRWMILLLSQAQYNKEDMFASLYDRSPVAFLTLNTKGAIVNANPAAVYLLESSLDNIGGVDFFNLIVEDDDTDPEMLRGKIGSEMTVNDKEVPVLTIKGNQKWVMLSAHAYSNQGEHLVSIVDVTDQKNIDTAKSEFVALATHQLRTPIAAIRWNVELLEKTVKETQTEKQTRYLSKINRNVIRMIDLINDFLSVSKLEMGTYAADMVDLNMTEFFSAILDEFAEKLTEKDITVSRNENPPQLTIRTDRRLIHIITSNLVSNAVKYLNSGGKLDLSFDLQKGVMELVVADNGIGIPSNEIENLFTKFYRATNAQSQQTEGTGLGLYIVKQSAEQLGGAITVESEENEGARFIVRLPVDERPTVSSTI